MIFDYLEGVYGSVIQVEEVAVERRNEVVNALSERTLPFFPVLGILIGGSSV